MVSYLINHNFHPHPAAPPGSETVFPSIQALTRLSPQQTLKHMWGTICVTLCVAKVYQCGDVTDVLEEIEGKSFVAVCGRPLLYDSICL